MPVPIDPDAIERLQERTELVMPALSTAKYSIDRRPPTVLADGVSVEFNTWVVTAGGTVANGGEVIGDFVSLSAALTFVQELVAAERALLDPFLEVGGNDCC